MTPNIRLRAALCLALSLADVLRARAEEPKPPTAALQAPPPAEDDQNPCLKYADTVAKWQEATHQVTVAKRELARLDANPVMVSESWCSGDASWRCRDTYFSRERAMERAKDRLEDAQTRVRQLEESARVAGVPQKCLVE